MGSTKEAEAKSVGRKIKGKWWQWHLPRRWWLRTRHGPWPVEQGEGRREKKVKMII